MSAPDPVVYLSGEYLPKSQARISVEDRGTLFADGVYEVIRYYAGQPLALEGHLARLRRSLGGIRLPEPSALEELPAISDELLRRNGIRDAKMYWQITRGQAPREHCFPATCEPTVLAIAYPVGPMNLEETPASWRVCLDEDRRWTECWIKSLMLLPNVLARQAAREAGCQEVILHRDGRVTEGSAANVFIVRGGELVTHPADRWILSGITRNLLIELARAEGVTVREEPFTTDELLAADEIFFTGTTTHLAAAVEVDGQTIGEGTPGPVTRQLHRIFVDHVARTCGLR